MTMSHFGSCCMAKAAKSTVLSKSSRPHSMLCKPVWGLMVQYQRHCHLTAKVQTLEARCKPLAGGSAPSAFANWCRITSFASYNKGLIVMWEALTVPDVNDWDIYLNCVTKVTAQPLQSPLSVPRSYMTWLYGSFWQHLATLAWSIWQPLHGTSKTKVPSTILIIHWRSKVFQPTKAND